MSSSLLSKLDPTADSRANAKTQSDMLRKRFPKRRIGQLAPHEATIIANDVLDPHEIGSVR